MLMEDLQVPRGWVLLDVFQEHRLRWPKVSLGFVDCSQIHVQKGTTCCAVEPVQLPDPCYRRERRGYD